MTRALVCVALLASSACIDRIGGRRPGEGLTPGAVHPDVAPLMLNPEPPFRYPAPLWAQRVQGNVTLRVYVDAKGDPVDDSTRVIEGSGIPALDSAALAGARELKFRPARLRDVPVGVSLTLPVFFRHPDAPPLPGDSVLQGNRRPPPRT